MRSPAPATWKLTLTAASGTARPWLSTTSASTRSLCPGRQKNSRVALRGAIAGEELAEHVLGRTAFYQRYKSPGVSLGDGEVADERLSKERGECLDRFGGGFKNDVAGFGMRERAVGDFVDPHTVTLEVKHALAEVGIAGRVAFLRDDERARGVVRFRA